ncbi:MAG: hypothetical protein QOG72_1354 [Sphingomonadales bacterium]|jgi:hypothetical protein|nr:hypothetical protein [Sphingomonadales bacterium]
MATSEISIAAANAAPDVDLNGEAAGNDTSLGYAENNPPVAIAPAATAADDSADLEDGSLTVAFTAGGTADDQLLIVNQGFGQGQFFVDEGTLYYGGAPVGSVTGGTDGSTPLVVNFFASMTPAIAQALIRSIGYVNFSDAPAGGDRTVTFTLSDGDGGTSIPRNATIGVTAVDDPAVAQDDTVVTDENMVAAGSVFADNGGGPDFDPDNAQLTVSAVNDSSENVGVTITLESGARLTVNSDGTYSYDPNGQFDYLVGPGSGAVNTTATDTFEYTLANGNSATVTVIVQGVSGPGDQMMGDSTDNVITGTPQKDLILVQQGGNDTVFALGDDDVIYFGSTFTRRDSVDGGDGRDVVILQGNYTLALSATNLSGVESLSLQSGSNTRFGDTANNFYDYNITTNDSNVAAGQQMIVNGQSLRGGEDLIFDGSAERDGSFLVVGGHGVDTLRGGDGNDVFAFGGDRWGAGDSVNGGAGRDAVVISAGNGLTHIQFGAASLVNVESVSVTNRYAPDPGAKPSYEFVLNNGNVAEGDTLIVNGSSLADPTQTISVDGSAVQGGNLILFGGAGRDVLKGGAGGDLIQGGLGGDSLTGGAGADVFRYSAAADSAGRSIDSILDFAPGVDKVDLHLIDADTQAAGDQEFHYIGSGGFTGDGAASAGELRIYQSENVWFAEGDTDGDGQADLTIALTLPGDTELTFGDFLP